MRRIVKGKEPQKFIDWKAKVNEDWQSTYGELSGVEKLSVKQALMREQGGICCYCESQLTEADSHIEHCKPQHIDNVDALDFSNMICSCQSRLKKGDPRHCGNAKGDWYDVRLFISPLTMGDQQRFSFTADGQILPTINGDDAAQETIKRLALDIPKLTKMRAKAIEPFLDESLSDEEFDIFVTGYLRVGEDDALNAFYSVVQDVFKENIPV